MNRPLIGITTARTASKYGYSLISITEAYVQSLMQAGALPVLVPLGLEENDLEEIAGRLDGILFSGGGDIHPARYGQEMSQQVNTVDLDRDRVEIHLAKFARERDLPFLGICRGLQVLNVAFGGDLYRDIGEEHPNALQHDCFLTHGRGYHAHEVEVQPGSLLASLLGRRSVQVNSLHHQGVNRLAPELVPTAYAPDGLVEAFELPDQSFGVAIQWHPEWLPDQPEMRAIFHAFTQAAGGAS